MTKRKVKRNISGFQEDVQVVGSSDTDADMRERLKLHKQEIAEFYRTHPTLKRKKVFDDETD